MKYDSKIREDQYKRETESLILEHTQAIEALKYEIRKVSCHRNSYQLKNENAQLIEAKQEAELQIEKKHSEIKNIGDTKSAQIDKLQAQNRDLYKLMQEKEDNFMNELETKDELNKNFQNEIDLLIDKIGYLEKVLSF